MYLTILAQTEDIIVLMLLQCILDIHEIIICHIYLYHSITFKISLGGSKLSLNCVPPVLSDCSGSSSQW